jgi:hypothetical protein
MARVHARSRGDAALGRERLLAAFEITDDRPPDSPTVLWSSAPG